MSEHHDGDKTSPTKRDDTFGSNAIRLTIRQWRLLGVVVLAVVLAVPIVWRNAASFEPAGDYRIPFALSNDYWIYQRWVTRTLSKDERVLLLGDSVIWGEYVPPSQTLTQYLNYHSNTDQFSNGGLNGAHPLALEGLVRYYTKDLKDRSVILHCNLLWTCSEERDLQVDEELNFNHPRLVPQFWPKLPCYVASANERIGIVVDHHVPFRHWVHHLRIAFFESLDIHNWSLEHPYDNPLKEIRLEMAQPEGQPHSEPVSWLDRGAATTRDLPWIQLSSSMQWRTLVRTLERLTSRGNRVFVVVGPFNEHMLTDASRGRYVARKSQVQQWLQQHSIPAFVPDALPSHLYADASHPMADGYELLAQQLLSDRVFQEWLRGEPDA